MCVHEAMDEVVTTARPPTPEVPAEPEAEFTAFFEAEHVRLFRALHLLTRDASEAEEVMQDAFLSLWERWHRLTSGPERVGYLYTTAMNAWRSRKRRTARVVRRVLHVVPPDDPSAVVDQRDAVLRALAPLPPRERVAIVLVDVLDLTSEEAARIMRVKSPTVRVLASRARKRLAKEMGERDE
jgi:RNA polymerase sigma-70 factor (ECF subfamily)